MRKNILLIGGSYGIGRAIAELLSEDHNVYVCSRTSEGLEGLNVQHILFDVLADTLVQNQIPDSIDGFVYCPGSINLKPLKMMGLEIFKKDMEVNFFGLVKTVREILPKMSKGASMVFFSTVATGTGMPYHTSVAAAKGAVEGFARSLAAEYAPDLRVNVIAPSLVDTPLAGRLLSNDKKRELMALRYPLKRIGVPNDIARCAHFLLSDASDWMSGEVIGVDGGLSNLNVN